MKTGYVTVKVKLAREHLAASIVHRVIRDLQQMQDSSMLLSGEDSGLRDVWDEICVQRQTEESIHWAAYEQSVRALIEGMLDDCSQNQLADLWQMTEAGEDWLYENPEDKRPALNKADIVEFIMSELLNKAVNHTNVRIRAHIERSTRTD